MGEAGIVLGILPHAGRRRHHPGHSRRCRVRRVASRRHARAALRAIAIAMALDAAWMVFVQTSRHRLGQQDREHLLVMGGPAALAGLSALAARRRRSA